MLSLRRAENLGRQYDHIARARFAVGVMHFVLGAFATVIVNMSIRAGMWGDWWSTPVRALGRASRGGPAGLVLFGALILPAVPYVASWWRVGDSVFEDLTGTRFWTAAGVYFGAFTLIALASDAALVTAIAPPLSLWWVAALLLATHFLFVLIATTVEFLFAGKISPGDDSI